MKPDPTALIRLILACAAATLTSFVLINGLLSTSVAQSAPHRIIDNEVPKNVPIKLKLKVEKEERLKDRSNPEWLRDFELEVTNTSNKPIYFIRLYLLLPDTKSDKNNPVSFVLSYGRADFKDFSTRPGPADVPIQPGETHPFTIDESFQQAWRQFRARTNKDDPAKLKIRLVHLSFGDGSGFDSGGIAYPYDRSELSAQKSMGRNIASLVAGPGDAFLVSAR